jgi:hypothetical protein
MKAYPRGSSIKSIIEINSREISSTADYFIFFVTTQPICGGDAQTEHHPSKGAE